MIKQIQILSCFFLLVLGLSAAPGMPLAPAQSPSSAVHASRGSWRSLITPKDDVRLSVQLEGIVKEYPLVEGVRVKKGDAIMLLDDRAERIQLQNADGALRRAEAERVKAQKDFERIKSLYDEKIASDKQLSEVTYSLEQAEAACIQAKSSVEMAKLQLDYRRIQSPCDGVFFKKFKSVGEAVQRHEVVARVIDDSSLEVVVYASAVYFGKVALGQEIPLQLLDGLRSGDTVMAKVIALDSLIDPASGTFRIKMQVQPEEGVYGGLSVLVQP
jgi:RND family efflux transporter MFP subunit